jgi:8-oxo-dGTP pyrophosphatase MutT (NUDIX family)
VIDPSGYLFMFRYDNVEIGVHWSMPGGGLELGESEAQGAVREVREETGWTDIDAGVPWFSWEHDYTRPEGPVRQSEVVYLLGASELTGLASIGRTPHREPVGDLLAAHREDGILLWRWWSPAELAVATEPMWPPVLADLHARLLAEGPPASAIDLGYMPNGDIEDGIEDGIEDVE